MLDRTKIDSLILEREIISSKEFGRLKFISLAVSELAVKDTAQNRQSHSFEVANTAEIMNVYLSEKLGFQTDYLKLSRSVSLSHDIGHMSFGHLAEHVMNHKFQDLSGGRIFYDSNANNYKKLQKIKILSNISKDVKNYYLASLAKHPESLYPEQEGIKKMVEIEVKKELAYLKTKMNINKLEKTLQCQIMDIADENSYIISDIVDALNVLTIEEMIELLFKELPFEVANKLVKAINNKSNFKKVLNELFFEFCDNFILSENGVLEPISEDIENIRMKLAFINREYLLKHKDIIEIRNKEEKILNIVINYFINNYDNLPSKFYAKKMSFANSFEEKMIIVRDFLGGMTDKGLMKEYKKIKNARL